MPSGQRTHVLNFRVRYSECDPMNVAHHSAYPVWFEIGRTELLRQASGGTAYRELETQGVFLAVVALEVKYKRPARYDDELTLHTMLAAAGHVKIQHTYELFREGLLLATGATTLACLDREGRPQPIPASLLITPAGSNCS